MRAKKGQIARAETPGLPRLAGAEEHPMDAVFPGNSPMLVVDRALTIHSCNEGAALLFGRPQAAIPSLTELKLGPSLSRHIEGAFAQSASRRLRLAFRGRRLETTISPFSHASGSMMLVLFHDVTELVKAAVKWKRASAQARLEASYGTAALDSLSALIAVLDREGVILSVNRQWRQRGHSAPAPPHLRTVGGNYFECCASWTSTYGAAKVGQVIDGIRAVLRGEQDSFSTNYSYQTGGDSAQWFNFVVSPLEYKGGLRGAVVTHFDVTDQVRLAEEKARHVVAMQSSANAIFITDAAGRIDWANDAFLRVRGYRLAEAESLPPGSAALLAGGPEFAATLDSCARSGLRWSGEVKLRNKTGDAYTVEQTITPILNASGEISHFVVVQEDITHDRETQLRMMYMAEHDDLTGLLNRKSFDDRLRLAIVQHHSMERQLAVLLVDLDRFKDANETLGHGAGDLILAEAAARLRDILGASDSVARFGGDEFVILLTGCGDQDQVKQSAKRVLACFRRPFTLEGHSVSIGASVGIAMFPADGVTHEDLLRAADLALYRAKAEGRRGVRFFDKALEAEVSERVAIERELHGALGTPDLWIAYQPQWEIQSGRIIGAESLLRWNPAISRSIPMGRIVSMAEESGLILPIGQWVIKKALAQLHIWQRRFGPDFTMSINLSAVQLNRQDVSALFTHAIRSLGIRPATLKVEITESVLAQNSDRVLGALNALHAAGIGLALDDFGTGYSSLTYLQQFPIERVKIDTSFVKEIGRRTQDDAIVKGIVQLSHSLGLTVVAEGVETEDQLAFLRAVGCDLAQGYRVSPAVPPAEFERFLIAHRGAAHSASAP